MTFTRRTAKRPTRHRGLSSVVLGLSVDFFQAQDGVWTTKVRLPVYLRASSVDALIKLVKRTAAKARELERKDWHDEASG